MGPGPRLDKALDGGITGGLDKPLSLADCPNIGADRECCAALPVGPPGGGGAIPLPSPGIIGANIFNTKNYTRSVKRLGKIQNKNPDKHMRYILQKKLVDTQKKRIKYTGKNKVKKRILPR